MLGAMAFTVPSVQANSTAAAVGDPQIRVQIGRRNRNRGIRRVVVSTRIRWVGRYRYRETIRTTYFRNGRVRVDVISRVRLGGRRYRNY